MIYGGSPFGALEYGGILSAQNGSGIIIKKTTSAGVITNITSYILWQSVELVRVLTKEVSTLKFDIFNAASAPLPSAGDQIDVYENNYHIFGGTVTDANPISDGGILLRYQFSCIDWSYKLNSKLVVKSYTSQDPAVILRDIVSTFGRAGFTTYNVQTAGFNVSSIKFNYEQITVAIEKLAQQIGWEWFIDADKDIHFFPPGAVANAPYTIDDTSGNLEWATLDVDQSIVNLKNSIYVIGGNYSKAFDASSTPDIYLTDGTAGVFPLAYPYTQSTIVVTLNGVAQSVGTDQVTDPTSVQVLYNQGGRFVRFTTIPTTGKTVKAYGTAMIPILAHVQDQASIATYGEIQASIIDQQIQSISEAQERGNAQISQFSSPVYAVKFATVKTGFVQGQIVRVSSTIFGTSVLVEIKRITGRMYGPSQFRYEIECVGTESVSFVDIMKLLLTQNNASTIISDSTVLQVILLINESVIFADTLSTPTTSSPPYKWGTMKWGLFTWHS